MWVLFPVDTRGCPRGFFSRIRVSEMAGFSTPLSRPRFIFVRAKILVKLSKLHRAMPDPVLIRSNLINVPYIMCFSKNVHWLFLCKIQRNWLMSVTVSVLWNGAIALVPRIQDDDHASLRATQPAPPESPRLSHLIPGLPGVACLTHSALLMQLASWNEHKDDTHRP